MKKSLLMTIIMSLVLVVAMSTATYAWYTSSSTVNVASTTVTAATSDSSNIGIGADANATGTTHTITVSSSATLSPMVPVTTDGTITKTTAFTTAVQTTANTFSDPKAGSPATYQDFYVVNHNKDNAVNVQAAVTIVDENATNLGLCVAVFAGDTCLGVWSDDTVHYAKTAITEGAGITTVSENVKNDVLASGALSTAFPLAKASTTGANSVIKVIAWFDGVQLIDAESAATATFSISFSAETVA